ncbi:MULTISPECIES: hypothetical protein [Candidatus Ichthyocystis]|nr:MULTISPECIES: hypothetical protein [Ichthyocystis]
MLIFPLKSFVMQLVKGPFEVPTRGSRGMLSPHFRVIAHMGSGRKEKK